MITITENIPSRMPGITSLYVSFDYNEELINCFKYLPDPSHYDKKTKLWETCITNLSTMLDMFCKYDDISFIPYKEPSKGEKTFTLSEYKVPPFAHQLEGIQFGLNHDKWLLLDEPGLGKTATIIHIAEELHRRGEISHCLVICGVNTLKTNWKNEIAKHSSLSAKILGERVNRKGRIVFGGIKDRLSDLQNTIEEFFVITNIETIRSDAIVKEIEKGVNHFDMIALDEAHCIKTISSEQGKNLQKLKSAKYKIAATGTLITNTPVDAYAPLKWLDIEHSNSTNFKRMYCQFGNFKEIVGYKNIDILKKQIEDNCLRRTKELLDLPEKTIINEWVDMEENHRKFYDDIVNGIIQQADKVELNTDSLLSMAVRLRQSISCPSILTSDSIISNKIIRAKDLAQQIISGGDKVVIYSVFKQTLNDLYNMLPKEITLVCTGDVSQEQIDKNIELFQNDDKHKIILATTQKMGTGITLTAANYAIFVDSNWTAAMNEQCEDRLHRIGSKKPVFIYYLWMNRTIDYRIKQVVQNKSLVFNYIVDDELDNRFIDILKSIIADLKEDGN